MRFSCPGSSIKRQGGHFYIIDLILVGTKELTNPHLLRLPLLTFLYRFSFRKVLTKRCEINFHLIVKLFESLTDFIYTNWVNLK